MHDRTALDNLQNRPSTYISGGAVDSGIEPPTTVNRVKQCKLKDVDGGGIRRENWRSPLFNLRVSTFPD